MPVTPLLYVSFSVLRAKRYVDPPFRLGGHGRNVPPWIRQWVFGIFGIGTEKVGIQLTSLILIQTSPWSRDMTL